MGDLNRHVDNDSYDFDQVHMEYGYDTRNDEENVVLRLALMYHLIVASKCFKKRDSHLIAFRIGGK
ncbi:hypothetical protein H5410_050525 [Solanum commersonii]|uniref:Uncharacterized protein n=1 Tax=Solanum commersonii TaxID=4109 RepID=A0A9J5WVS5_SOLCO|nr:hypothetical protein H5410_050525 [Solanum commersonii]